MNIADQFAALPVNEVLIAERSQHMALYREILKLPNAYVGGTLCIKYRSKIGAGAGTGGGPSAAPFSELEDFNIEMYSGKGTLDQVRALADRLQRLLASYAPDSPHFIVMKTDIAYTQYSLHLDNSRLLATIYELQDRGMAALAHGKVRIVDGMKLLSTKAQLVDIYRELYMPRPDIWQQLAPRLQQLHSVQGGDDRDAGQVTRDRLRVIQKFACAADVMLVGDHALQMRRGQPFRSRPVQLLALHPDKLAKEIAQALDGELYTTREPIMRDARLQRTSIRAHGADIVHIYHNCTYDVIGYVNAEYNATTYRVGCYYALSRFILVDFWLLVGKLSAGRLQANFFEDKKRELLGDLATIQAKDDVVPPEQYMGQYISDIQHAKNARKEQNFMPYYPSL